MYYIGSVVQVGVDEDYLEPIPEACPWRVQTPAGVSGWYGQGNARCIMPKIKEADLYPPLKAWLEDNGYTVYAEVNDCDIAAQKNGAVVLIEMKPAINLDLVLQVVRWQKMDASVYAAVPAPKCADRRWRELLRLLRRLEAGLLLVHLESALPRIEVAFHSMPLERRKSKDAMRALLTEMSGRSVDTNIGGTNRRPRMTAYREQALHVALALERHGPTSPKALRLAGTAEKTGLILRDNHYGWFERLQPGVYALTVPGREALTKYPELAERLRLRLDQSAASG